MTDGDPWSVKQHNRKSEAKEDHQLSPSEPNNSRKSSGPYQLKSIADSPKIANRQDMQLYYNVL